VNGAGECGVGLIRVHRGEDAMDGFVSADAEDGGTENALCFGIDDSLHEPEGLAFFDGAGNGTHGTRGDEEVAAGGARFFFGHAHLREWRIGVGGANRNPVGDAARGAVEEVGSYDFEVVVRGVGEGAASVTVAQCPDVGHVGAKLIVNGDVAVGIGAHAG